MSKHKNGFYVGLCPRISAVLIEKNSPNNSHNGEAVSRSSRSNDYSDSRCRKLSTKSKSTSPKRKAKPLSSTPTAETLEHFCEPELEIREFKEE
jgi:hypothetical protein